MEKQEKEDSGLNVHFKEPVSEEFQCKSLAPITNEKPPFQSMALITNKKPGLESLASANKKLGVESPASDNEKSASESLTPVANEKSICEPLANEEIGNVSLNLVANGKPANGVLAPVASEEDLTSILDHVVEVKA
jgi:hypothetical protein